MKSERNKTHSEILYMTQGIAEQEEKAKIIANEVEILRSVVEEKEK